MYCLFLKINHLTFSFGFATDFPLFHHQMRLDFVEWKQFHFFSEDSEGNIAIFRHKFPTGSKVESLSKVEIHFELGKEQFSIRFYRRIELTASTWNLICFLDPAGKLSDLKSSLATGSLLDK